MADVRPAPPPRPTTTSSNAANASSCSTVRDRFLRKQSSSQNLSSSPKPQPPDLLRRRSSIISDITDDLINPTTRGQGQVKEDVEVTHWHSTPLAFAILPAIAGLLFKNGSAFVTDCLLLCLAAIFMNWSIRIPWDWYYSAQAIRNDVEPDIDMDTISEETDETAVETASDGSPSQPPADSYSKTLNVGKREEAAADLRQQELLALGATFLFPALAAYLLHVIRDQLSRPSESLVSDYNLSIFLLAAEIRPVRQLIRLMANRTLYLQRQVTGIDDPFASAIEERSTIHNLTSRIAELEARLSDYSLVPSNVVIAQKADVSDLSAEMRKRYETRLEGLERAVRRYEKRSTTLAMLTEQRLNQLETRLQDALSLAAVAAQHSQQRLGVFVYVFETFVAFPVKVGWSICMYPVALVEEIYAKVKNMMLGPAPARAAKRRHGSREDSMDEKSKAKNSSRKVVR